MRKTKYEKLAAYLQCEFIDGKEPMSPLPSIPKLMESQSVSQATVDRAMGLLEQQGLIIKMPGVGCFVSEQANAVDENETVGMIKTINDKYKIVVDPHTAVGIGAVKKLGLEKNCVVLSTAHPCKFPKAIEDAISKTENLPDSLKYVNDRKEKFELLSNDIEKVKKYVMNSI